jgi:hypothetical protein
MVLHAKARQQEFACLLATVFDVHRGHIANAIHHRKSVALAFSRENYTWLVMRRVKCITPNEQN